jgi:hypothetical protein
MAITFGDATEDKKIKITKEAIHKVFGYPKGMQKSAPRPRTCQNSMKELMLDLGFKRPDFKPKELFENLEKLVELDDEESNSKSVKIFFLIFFHSIVCGTSAAIFSQQAITVKDMKYEEIAQMDFSEVIVERIKAGAMKWQEHRTLDQEKKEQKARQWFGTGTSNHVSRLPAPTHQHERHAQHCQENG